jgi:hypothetical protein
MVLLFSGGKLLLRKSILHVPGAKRANRFHKVFFADPKDIDYLDREWVDVADDRSLEDWFCGQIDIDDLEKGRRHMVVPFLPIQPPVL